MQPDRRAILLAPLFAGPLLANAALAAETADGPDILRRAPGQAPAAASVADAAWFAGTWIGEVFGQRVEHVVMTPSGGQMPGLVRLIDKGRVSFYELSSFIELPDGALTYRNRHFAPDLVAQQDRADFVDRPLVSATREALYFDNITFAKDGRDRAIVAFALPQPDGAFQRHVVRYARAA